MKLLQGLSICAFFLVASLARADEGNGVGNAYIKTTPVKIGGNVTIDFGSPGLAFGQAILLVASSPGPVVEPTLGTICLNIYDPGILVYSTFLDVNGNASVSAAVPNFPSLVNNPPVYALALVVDFSLPAPFVSISKTVRLNFENGDGWHGTTGSMGSPRALHTSTAMGAGPADNVTRVLVAGGGNGTLVSPVSSNTTEIYNPVTRSFTAGPLMAVERALHQAVRLPNGRLLVIGGVATVGTCSTNCELFDPATNSFSPTGSMNVARAGFQATLMPNGKVLVSGGVTTFVGGSTNLSAVLNTAQNTTETYDPATGVWTAGPNMAANRFGHAHTLLPNGNVLISGGITGGSTILGQTIVNYTSNCQIYNMASNTFSATGSLPSARAGHSTSVLGNGNVLATGGIQNVLLVPTTINAALSWNGTSWSTVGSLPGTVAFHSQVTSPTTGEALIAGGLAGNLLSLTASAVTGRHNGTSFTIGNALGTNPGIPGALSSPRGSHTMTPLHDGSYLLVGGADGAGAFANAYVWIQ